MSVVNDFQGLPRILRFILLLIPGLNWVVEVIIRLSAYMNKKTSLLVLVLAIFPPTGVILGWIDCFFTLVSNKLVAM
ncbi:MAG: hypothetical protein J1G04_05200 [Clostridiales bacterium]|nr:hypothetical protein [Clostridiales bacterium]